jgi:hypothetical protein
VTLEREYDIFEQINGDSIWRLSIVGFDDFLALGRCYEHGDERGYCQDGPPSLKKTVGATLGRARQRICISGLPASRKLQPIAYEHGDSTLA